LKQLDKTRNSLRFHMLINNVSESFLPVGNSDLIRLIPFLIHKKDIKRGKNDLKVLSHQDVVYKITCNDCEATYIR